MTVPDDAVPLVSTVIDGGTASLDVVRITRGTGKRITVTSAPNIDEVPTENTTTVLNSLKPLTPPSLKSLSEEESVAVELGVDSGASETAIPPDEIKNVPTIEGEQSTRGIQYESASGDLLPNLGDIHGSKREWG